ncbi:MAG: NADH-quinone oxidoreductase subunit K [Chloroflexi bacterium]|nr:NADH-quinone oxidoreductase subunit K [Chloroflexota bacterium]
MTLIYALAAGALFGIGAYLVMRRDLLRVVLGVVVISQAATLTLMASALGFGAAPIYPLPSGAISDPLSQAMALTSVVIGLATTALLLVLVLRVVDVFRSQGLDEVAEDEVAQEATLDAEHALGHEDEEAAAR